MQKAGIIVLQLKNFDDQNSQRVLSKYKEMIKDLTQKVAKDQSLPTLKKIIQKSKNATLYGLSISTNEHIIKKGRHIIENGEFSFEADDLKNYKVIALSGLESYLSNYFYLLKRSPKACYDFFNQDMPNEKFEMSSQPYQVNYKKEDQDILDYVSYQRALLIVNKHDPSINMIIGITFRHSFLGEGDGITPIFVEHHQIDKDFMQNGWHMHLALTPAIPIKKVDSKFLTWLIRTSSAYQKRESFSFLAPEIEYNTKSLKLYMNTSKTYDSDDPFKTTLFVQSKRGYRTDSLSFWDGTVQYFLSKLRLVQKDNQLYFKITYQGHTYQCNARYNHNPNLFLEINQGQIAMLINRIFQVPIVYGFADEYSWQFDPQSSNVKGMCHEINSTVSDEINSFCDYLRDRGYARNSLMYYLMHTNLKLIKQIRNIDAGENTETEFNCEELKPNESNQDISSNLSGLEQIADLLGKGNKKLLIENGKVIALYGNDRLEKIRERSVKA